MIIKWLYTSIQTILYFVSPLTRYELNYASFSNFPSDPYRYSPPSSSHPSAGLSSIIEISRFTGKRGNAKLCFRCQGLDHYLPIKWKKLVLKRGERKRKPTVSYCDEINRVEIVVPSSISMATRAKSWKFRDSFTRDLCLNYSRHLSGIFQEIWNILLKWKIENFNQQFFDFGNNSWETFTSYHSFVHYSLDTKLKIRKIWNVGKNSEKRWKDIYIGEINLWYIKIYGSDLERKKRKNYFSKLITCLLYN